MPWTNCTFNTAVSNGGGEKQMVPVEGLSNGTFGIDERPNLRNARSKAWAIIHLRTGRAAAFVGGTLAKVKRVAADLTDVASWEFNDDTPPVEVRRGARLVIAKHASVLLESSDVGSFKKAFTYPEENAQAMEAREGGDARQAPSPDDSAVHAPKTPIQDHQND